jgi:hypothetical protein
MKNLFALLTVIGAGFIAAPDAEARPGCNSSHTYVSHYTSCGCPVYVQRYVAYYDRCTGRPIYRTRTLSVNHRCRSHHAYGHSYAPRTHYGRSVRNHRSTGFRIGPVIVGGGSARRCR